MLDVVPAVVTDPVGSEPSAQSVSLLSHYREFLSDTFLPL